MEDFISLSTEERKLLHEELRRSSFLSIKYVVFDNDSSAVEKVQLIMSNSSFSTFNVQLSPIRADGKRCLNFTKYAAFSKQQNGCSSKSEITNMNDFPYEFLIKKLNVLY